MARSDDRSVGLRVGGAVTYSAAIFINSRQLFGGTRLQAQCDLKRPPANVLLGGNLATNLKPDVIVVAVQVNSI